MEKNTLKGKVKVFVYIVAFIIMIGVHKVIEKIGTGEPPMVTHQKGDYVDGIDKNITKVASLPKDSLFVSGRR